MTDEITQWQRRLAMLTDRRAVNFQRRVVLVRSDGNAREIRDLRSEDADLALQEGELQAVIGQLQHEAEQARIEAERSAIRQATRERMARRIGLCVQWRAVGDAITSEGLTAARRAEWDRLYGLLKADDVGGPSGEVFLAMSERATANSIGFAAAQSAKISSHPRQTFAGLARTWTISIIAEAESILELAALDAFVDDYRNSAAARGNGWVDEEVDAKWRGRAAALKSRKVQAAIQAQRDGDNVTISEDGDNVTIHEEVAA